MNELDILTMNLKKYMRLQGLSQQNLAERSNVSLPTINNLVNCNFENVSSVRSPNLKLVLTVAKALGVSIMDLFTPEDAWTMTAEQIEKNKLQEDHERFKEDAIRQRLDAARSVHVLDKEKKLINADKCALTIHSNDQRADLTYYGSMLVLEKDGCVVNPSEMVVSLTFNLDELHYLK